MLVEPNSLGEQPSEWKTVFASAAAWFGEVAAYADGRWDEPGLGEWTVRDLVGHTSRSLITTDEYLTDETTGDVDLLTAGAYYAAARSVDHTRVAQRGRDAGVALGEDPIGAVADLARRVPARVAAAAPEARLHTPFGSIVLGEYAVTRSFELTVHTCDLLRALGRPADPPADAARSALRLVAELTAANGRGGEALIALTGRTGLPEGFTAL